MIACLERVLAEQLGVARPVLREAIRLLEERGLLRRDRAVAPGCKSWRRMCSAAVAARISIVGYPDAMAKMHELRLSIEPVIAGLAQRATSEQIAQPMSMPKPCPMLSLIAPHLPRLTNRFTSLCEAAGNEYVGLLLQPLQETLAAYLHQNPITASRAH